MKLFYNILFFLFILKYENYILFFVYNYYFFMYINMINIFFCIIIGCIWLYLFLYFDIV